MALRKHILVFLIFFIGVFHIFASDANYTIYSIGNEGTTCKFEDTRVNCIYKDSDGFLWIGTGLTVERINGPYPIILRKSKKE